MQFSYEKYAASQATKKSNTFNKDNVNGPRTHFINEWLKNDGDVVVVRFPYHSMDDIMIDATHTVTFPGDKWAKRVRCEGDNCPLCKQGVKLDHRFFVKAIVYVTDDNGSVSLVPAIWDRAATFADIEMKGLIDEYGDLSDCLFKIKRNGTGLETRYTINIVTNKVVYNPAVYKADFSILESVDPSRVLTRSFEQYKKALDGDDGQGSKEDVPAPVHKSEVKMNDAAKSLLNAEEEKEVEEFLGMSESKEDVSVEETPVENVERQRLSFDSDDDGEESSKQKRYSF